MRRIPFPLCRFRDSGVGASDHVMDVADPSTL
jgi:hypothetical protein